MNSDIESIVRSARLVRQVRVLRRSALAIGLLAMDFDPTVGEQLTDRLEVGLAVVHPYLR